MLRLRRHERRARIATLAQRNINRNLTQERRAHIRRHALRAAFAENVRALAETTLIGLIGMIVRIGW